MSKHLHDAKLALKTNLFKWSPDYLSAAMSYEKAAVSFKASRSLDDSVEAHMSASEMHLKMGNEAGCAKNLEQAGSCLMEGNSSQGIEARLKELERAADCYGRAAGLMREEGENGKAAANFGLQAKAYVAALDSLPDAHTKREAMIQGALQSYFASVDLYETSGRQAFGVDTLRGLLAFTIKIQQWNKTIEVLIKIMEVFKALKQDSTIHKLHFSTVIVNLKRNDFVAAQTSFRAGFDDNSYLRSDECAAAEDLLRAWENGDEEQVRNILRRPVMNFLERQITLLARDLSPFNVAPVKKAIIVDTLPAPIVVNTINTEAPIVVNTIDTEASVVNTTNTEASVVDVINTEISVGTEDFEMPSNMEKQNSVELVESISNNKIIDEKTTNNEELDFLR